MRTTLAILLIQFVLFSSCRATDAPVDAPTTMLEDMDLPDTVVLVAGIGRPSASYAVAARLLASHRDQLPSLTGAEIPPTLPELLARSSFAPVAAAIDWERPLRLVALGDGAQTIVLAHLSGGDTPGLPAADGAPLALPGFHVMRLGSVVALLSDGEPLGDDLRQWLQRVASCLQRADVSLVVNIAGSRALGGVLWRTWAEAIRSGESHVDLGPVARSIAPVVEAADRAIVSLSLTPEAVTLEAALTLVPGTAPWAAFAQVAPHPEEALAMAGPETVAVASVGLGEGLPAWIVDKATAAIRKEDPAAAAAAGVLLSELRAPAAVVESTTNRPVLVASWRVTRATDARDLLFTFVSRITKGPAVIEAMAAVGDDPLDLFVDDDVEGHFGVVRGRGVVAVGSGAQAMLRRETSGPTSDGVRRALDRQLPSAAAFAWAATSWLEDPSAPVAQPGAGIGLSAGASTGALRARLDVPAESLAWVLHHLDGVLPDELLPEEEQARRRRDRLLIRRGGYAPPELPEGIEAELEALEALESEGEPDWAPAPPLHAPPIPQPPTSPLPLDGGFGVVEDLPIDTDFDPLGVPAPLPNTFPAAEPWE